MIERRTGLAPEHLAEIDEYRHSRRFCFDHEAHAYATALSWADDDYSDDDGISIPDPADPTTDCDLIPDRFRTSFEQLPSELKPSVARLYRRSLVYGAVRRGRATRPLKFTITITAAAGIEFDRKAARWRPVGAIAVAPKNIQQP